MLHKIIKLYGIKVKLHSLDGYTWCASSPQEAAKDQLAFNQRRAEEYRKTRTYFTRYIPGGL